MVKEDFTVTRMVYANIDFAILHIPLSGALITGCFLCSG